tara:strand:+ start:1577 stop:1741 length:165 start_codon:yes stop_codon:yes gene_type:complete
MRTPNFAHPRESGGVRAKLGQDEKEMRVMLSPGKIALVIEQNGDWRDLYETLQL